MEWTNHRPDCMMKAVKSETRSHSIDASMPPASSPWLPRIVLYSGLAILIISSTGLLIAAKQGIKKEYLRGGINQKHTSQAAPAISADGLTLFYMKKDSTIKKNNITDNWDIWFATRKGNGWSAGQPLKALNNQYFQGYPSITADGRFLYFVANKHQGMDSNGKLLQDLDIYMTRKRGFRWSKPERLPDGINFKDTDENGASISPDGTQLVYFSSSGVGSRGGFDIYIARKNRRGKWGGAINVGRPVNTSYHETGPYLAPDGVTLYFSSNRPGGHGSYDLYKSH